MGLRFYSTCKLRDHNASFRDAGRRQTIPNRVPSFRINSSIPKATWKGTGDTRANSERTLELSATHRQQANLSLALRKPSSLSPSPPSKVHYTHILKKTVRNKAVRVACKYAETVRCAENRLPEPGKPKLLMQDLLLIWIKRESLAGKMSESNTYCIFLFNCMYHIIPQRSFKIRFQTQKSKDNINTSNIIVKKMIVQTIPIRADINLYNSASVLPKFLSLQYLNG